ncbi:MAG: hypothetical protein ACLTE2_03810 [Eubacteriales bacterium]
MVYLQTAGNAEWYFLKGTVLYKRGWMEEAIIITLQKHAIWIRPILNIRQLITKLKINVSGAYGGYNPGAPRQRRMQRL